MKNRYLVSLNINETKRTLVNRYDDILSYQTTTGVIFSNDELALAQRALNAVEMNIGLLEDDVQGLEQMISERMNEITVQFIADMESQIADLNDELNLLNSSLNVDAEISEIEELKTSLESLVNYYQHEIDLLTGKIFRLTENKSAVSNETIVGLDQLLASLKKSLASTQSQLTEKNALLTLLYKLKEFMLCALSIASTWGTVIAPLLPYKVLGISTLGLLVVLEDVRAYFEWFNG